MKTWKHGIIGILAIIALAFFACDDGNGKDKKDPCPCINKVHYDTPCDCVGVGNDCDCTVIYMPEFTDIFSFMNDVTPEAQVKISTFFNTILTELWTSDNAGKQLLLDLAAKTGKIQITYTTNNEPIGIDYFSGYFIMAGVLDTIDSADVANQLKAKLIEARDDATFV